MGNQIVIDHPTIEDNQKTLLTRGANAGESALSVINTSGFNEDQFVVIGEPGTERAEISRITAFPTSKAIMASQPLDFSYPSDSPVVTIDADKIAIYRSSTKNGTYNLIETIDIAIDQPNTPYSDASGASTDWYKTAYYNSFINRYGDLSGPILATGYSRYAVRAIVERVLSIMRDPNALVWHRHEIIDWINELHQQIYQELIDIDEDYGVVDTGVIDYTGGLVDLPEDWVNMINVEMSYNGGQTWNRAARGSLQLRGQNSYYYPDRPVYFLSGSQVEFMPVIGTTKYRFLYAGTTPYLSNDEDELPLFLHPYSTTYVNYCLYRAAQAEGTTAKDAPMPAQVQKDIMRIRQLAMTRNVDAPTGIEMVDDPMGMSL